MGLHRAWPDAEIVGVDINPQPRYPFTFVRADVLQMEVSRDGVFSIREYADRGPALWEYEPDFVWASPPCQAHVSLRWMHNAKKHTSLIEPVREMLRRSGVPYVMENVPGAPLINSVRLCGTSFGLGSGDAELWRHRHFEATFPIPPIACSHRTRQRVIGVYGGHGRDRRRKTNGQDYPTSARREAMGIDWMTGAELSQAIPPAFSEYIAKQFRRK